MMSSSSRQIAERWPMTSPEEWYEELTSIADALREMSQNEDYFSGDQRADLEVLYGRILRIITARAVHEPAAVAAFQLSLPTYLGEKLQNILCSVLDEDNGEDRWPSTELALLRDETKKALSAVKKP
jgi:hypothetical protein